MLRLADSVDHLVLATPDLDVARKEFLSLGFQVTPRAVHERFGTQNYLVVFEDSYIELLGVSGAPAELRTTLDVLEPCLAVGGGMPFVALAAEDLEAMRAGLSGINVQASEPLTWSRLAETPDGVKTASFTTMFLSTPLLPGVTTFYCQQHTPALVRHPAWQRHENGVRRLVGVTRESDLERHAAQELCARFGKDSAGLPDVALPLGRHWLRYEAKKGDGRTIIHVSSDRRTLRRDLSSVAHVSISLEEGEQELRK